MTITAHSTSQIITVSGIPGRLWEGQTSTGIKCVLFVPFVAIPPEEESRKAEFDNELDGLHAEPTDLSKGIPLIMHINYTKQ